MLPVTIDNSVPPTLMPTMATNTVSPRSSSNWREEVGVSAVYLTQSFREVEGVPLYRYQLRLRLARALDLLRDYEDLTALGLHLGFSSHSHFTAAFQQAYGRTPSEFRQAALHR